MVDRLITNLIFQIGTSKSILSLLKWLAKFNP